MGNGQWGNVNPNCLNTLHVERGSETTLSGLRPPRFISNDEFGLPQRPVHSFQMQFLFKPNYQDYRDLENNWEGPERL